MFPDKLLNVRIEICSNLIRVCELLVRNRLKLRVWNSGAFFLNKCPREREKEKRGRTEDEKRERERRGEQGQMRDKKRQREGEDRGER